MNNLQKNMVFWLLVLGILVALAQPALDWSRITGKPNIVTALVGLNTTGLVERTGPGILGTRTVGVATSSSIPSRADADARYRLQSGTVPYTELTNVPTNTIIGRVSSGTGASEALTPAQVRTMLSPWAVSDITGLQTALDGKAALSHTHPATEISDSTAAGRALLTAADAAAQRTALGLVAVASSGSATDLTSGTLPCARLGTFTGDVINSGCAMTIAADAVDDTKLANMPAMTIKGNDTGSTGNAKNLTGDEARVVLKIEDCSEGESIIPDPNFCSNQWVSQGGGYSPASQTTVTDGAVGTRVLRSASGAQSYVLYGLSIPVDVAKTYRISVWARESSGANGTMYAGFINQNGNGGTISELYPVINGVGLSTSWVEYAVNIGPDGSTTFPSGTKQVKPVLYLNYGATVGYNELQAFRMSEFEYVDQTEKAEYVVGFQPNTVYNGDFFRSDLSNWTAEVFDQSTPVFSTQVPAGQGLKGSMYGETAFAPQTVEPISVGDWTIFEAWLRGGNADGTGYRAADTIYGGLLEYGPSGVLIEAYQVGQVELGGSGYVIGDGPFTTPCVLANDLEPSDTTFTCTANLDWVNNATYNFFRWGDDASANWTDPLDNAVYATTAYSRNTSYAYYGNGTYNYKTVASISGAVATLTAGWLGPLIPAGTTLVETNFSNWGTYKYPLIAGSTLTNSWVKYSTTIKKSADQQTQYLWSLTAMVKPFFLGRYGRGSIDYTNPPTNTIPARQYITGIVVKSSGSESLRPRTLESTLSVAAGPQTVFTAPNMMRGIPSTVLAVTAAGVETLCPRASYSVANSITLTVSNTTTCPVVSGGTLKLVYLGVAP